MNTPFEMTERNIQDRLYMTYNAVGVMVVPNNMVFGWEMDTLVVRRSRITIEMEIKVTLGDFRADAAKKEKHEAMTKGYHIKSAWGGERRVEGWGANYFSYVVPHTIAEKVEAELPKHAGLIIVGEFGHIETKVDPPKLHGGKLTDKQMRQIMFSIYGKYWYLRRTTGGHDG